MEHERHSNKRKIPKGAILANLRKDKEEKQNKQKEEFASLYDKTKVYEFPPKDEINMIKHFYFPKFIGHPDFKRLTKTALAVYPVLCSQADFKENKWFQLSRLTIAKMTGVRPPSIDRGIQNLVENKYCLIDSDESISVPLLEREKKTEGKRHFYIYRAGFIRESMMKDWRGQFFVFHTCIVTSGVWAKLSPRAKALYLALRSVSRFDFNAFMLDHDLAYNEITFDEAYANRESEVCEKPLSELCRMANIESSNIKEVILQLEYHHLVEYLYNGMFIVYLKPKIRYNEDN